MREVITKDRQGRITAHKVYTRQEAEALGIPYVYWRDCTQPGLWTLTDDDHVLQALRVGRTNNGLLWVRNAIGTYCAVGRAKMTTEPRENRYTFSGRSAKAVKLTGKVVKWAKLFARGMDPVVAYKQVFRSRDVFYIRNRVNMFLKDEEVLKVVREELKEAFRKLGIDEEYVVSKYKRICEHGETHAVRLKALDSIAKMMGLMNADRTPQQNNVYLGFTESDIKRLEASASAMPGPDDEDRIRRINPALVEAGTQQEGDDSED